MKKQEVVQRATLLRALQLSAEKMFTRKNRDKGSMLLEAVVSVGLLSALTLGYTVSSTNADIAQRAAVNSSIASQVTQDVLETARSTPWSKVGTPAPPVGGLITGGAAHVTGELPATKKITSRGLELTVNTAVQWVTKTSGTGYGTKKIIVNVSWFDKVGDPSSKRNWTEPAILTPGIGEATPSSVRAGAEGSVVLFPVF